MVAGNKDKKLKVSEKGEEDNNQINEELVLSIEKLQEIQDDLEKDKDGDDSEEEEDEQEEDDDDEDDDTGK